ncbi:MAG: hypothetical protein JSU73_11040 [candidate division WOR-3 bacterium]|nr:MAG: hypothetical protein JSU73_11040 [candidate division WOR-3 bacterium]
MEGIAVRIAILSLLLGACALAQEFILNGDFEQPIEPAWTVDSGGHARATIERDSALHSDPDMELRVHIGLGPGYAGIGQTAFVPGCRLRFSAELCLYAHHYEPGNWSAASCRVLYLDSSLTTLGETRICYWHQNCPWQSTTTLHIVRTMDSSWQTWGFDIERELEDFLPGVDPEQVRAVRVVLKDTAETSCPPPFDSVRVLADNVSLMALTGMEEGRPTAYSSRPTTTVCRGVLRIEDGRRKTVDRADLMEITGRKVMDLRPGHNDVRHVAPGVYLVVTPSPLPSPPEGERRKERGLRPAESGRREAVRKVVIQR